jgi:DNA-binding NtrC family response regulator
VRILAATNRPLEDMVQKGQFRRDLYYRLNVVTLRMPPLRERKDDVPPLVEVFLKRYAEHGARKVLGVERDALYQLQRYDWPGNVRELEHAVERACALGQGEQLRIEDFPPDIRGGGALEAEIGVRSIEQLEILAIRRVLTECEGDTARAAELLGINRSTLYRKLKRYGLDLPGA